MFSRGLVTCSISNDEETQDRNTRNERDMETDRVAEVQQEQSELRRGASLPGVTDAIDFNLNCTVVFTARRSYASMVLGVVILSVRLSLCLSFRLSVTRMLCD